jgi:hypothetical protein
LLIHFELGLRASWRVREIGECEASQSKDEGAYHWIEGMT